VGIYPHFFRRNPFLTKHLKASRILKDIDNLQLTNKEILDLDTARKKLKRGESRFLLKKCG
jgi:hypothetical protein